MYARYLSEAKRPKLSNAAEKRQQAKSNKRKKSISLDDVNKENALPKTKKAKKAE